jgi:hypothetical protein
LNNHLDLGAGVLILQYEASPLPPTPTANEADQLNHPPPPTDTQVLGALASCFNNYLDLGAGVLILWYGGSIAMGGSGAITVGSLIKYQVRLEYSFSTRAICFELGGERAAFLRKPWAETAQSPSDRSSSIRCAFASDAI